MYMYKLIQLLSSTYIPLWLKESQPLLEWNIQQSSLPDKN